MSNIINDSLYFNAALEASKMEGNKAARKSNEAKKSEKIKSFSQILKDSTQEIQNQNEIPEIQGMSFEQAEQFLIDAVYSEGDKLKQSPVKENFASYKKAVGNFIKFVENQCYQVQEEKGAIMKVKVHGRMKSRQKCYTIIKVVNEKLDSLAQDILYNQSEILKMAAKIDDISGLLVDVFY